MKLSIFTPTHKAKWLKEAWDSIQSQADGLDIEWIVVPNGIAKTFALGLPEDPRIKVVPAPNSIKGVGALKGFACEHCSGDVLVELDHDDILMPGCLDAIAHGLHAKDKAFFYSSTYETLEDGRPNLFGAKWGWEWATVDGRMHNVAFEASWRTLCEIFYAPNHVRAWTRKAYEAAGKYDSSMVVCDDHDLLIRTYLSGAEFILDPRPLYHQRVHGSNTQKEQNGEIQKKQAELRDRHLHALAKEWSRRNSLDMLDLGGFFNCPQGFTPVDIMETENGVQVDLSKDRLPWDDNSVGIVRACDFLEHIPTGRVIPLIEEIWRVLAPGGLFYSLTPSTDGRGAFQDPTHQSYWNSNSWFYWTRENQAKYVPQIKARFQKVGMRNAHFGDFNKLHEIVHVEATLTALKGQRQPGMVEFCDYRAPSSSQ
jgi:glycosyltransferase involved in cell wall biosynthesis